MGNEVACSPFQAAISCRTPTIPVLRSLTDAGIRLVEIVPMDVREMSGQQRSARFDEIAGSVRQAGIGVWSVHIPFGNAWDISFTEEAKRVAAVDHALSILELCALLHPRIAIIHGSAEPITDEDRPHRIAASRKSLAQIAPAYAAAGVQLALENLPRTCLGNTAEELEQLAADLPELRFCLDCNHLLKQSHEYYLDRLADRVVTMHCSDYDGVDERHWLPGEGIVPWKLVRDELLASGYTGPFLFETWSHKDGKPIAPAEYPPALQRIMEL